MVDQKLLQKVQELRSQGYQNSQIIDSLQKDGHSSSQIFDALNQSSIGDGGPQLGLPPAPSFEPSNSVSSVGRAPEMPQMPSLDSFAPPPSTQAQPASRPSAQPSLHMRTQSPQHMPRTSDVSTEEYIEAIIDEKWTELEADVEKIVEWKNRSEQRITQLSQQVTDLKDRFDKLHAALIGKIETYDKNILEVGAEIKAMEKVFSKVLPVFTDNVKQLSDITEKMNKKSL